MAIMSAFVTFAGFAEGNEMFWYLPLEKLDERYTLQMYNWVIKALKDRGIEYKVIEGRPLAHTTKGDQFLHWASRVHYCSVQIAQIAKEFDAGAIQHGDTFFIADIWHLGIEAVAYMADAMGIRVKLHGVQHAGPFDPTDKTRVMLRWGKYQEAAWYEMFESVFVGSQYLKDTIRHGMETEGLDPTDNLIVTGQVWDAADAIKTVEPSKRNEKIVVWPHRLSDDKNVDDFYKLVSRLSQRFPNVRWIITSGRLNQTYKTRHDAVEFMTLTKPEYYQLLSDAVLMVSTAFHENFGYTIREATVLKTPILCPRRACYPESILTQENLYGTFDELCNKTESVLTSNGLPVAQIIDSGGIETMLNCMGF